MRISDWSSDVCSSDLHAEGLRTTAYHSTIKGARDFAEEMQSRGYRVDVVDSKAGRDHNSMVLDKYGNGEIGRASCRERVCQYGYISVVAVSIKQKMKQK